MKRPALLFESRRTGKEKCMEMKAFYDKLKPICAERYREDSWQGCEDCPFRRFCSTCPVSMDTELIQDAIDRLQNELLQVRDSA